MLELVEPASLAGRVALVTGAGVSGEELSLGRAIAVLCARRGATVAVLDLDEAAAKLTAEQIVEEGGQAFPLAADVSDAVACEAAVAEAARRHQRLDILVNNVGLIGDGGAVHELDEAAWDRGIDVNLKGAFLMAKYTVPVMPAGGAIVNISSTSAAKPLGATVYGPAKAGVEALTKALAAQYGPRGIRANAVAPGPMWTEMVARSYPPDAQAAHRERRRLMTALQVEGTAWDCARAVAFLASDEAAWITGQVLTVDGGAGIAGVPSLDPYSKII